MQNAVGEVDEVAVVAADDSNLVLDDVVVVDATVFPGLISIVKACPKDAMQELMTAEAKSQPILQIYRILASHRPRSFDSLIAVCCHLGPGQAGETSCSFERGNGPRVAWCLGQPLLVQRTCGESTWILGVGDPLKISRDEPWPNASGEKGADPAIHRRLAIQRDALVLQEDKMGKEVMHPLEYSSKFISGPGLGGRQVL